MNISEKVIDIVKGMEGIGGMPTDKEFLEEFQSRLQALTKNNLVKQYTEADMDYAYDKGIKDANQRDLTGSLIEVINK
jgi:hypothetical protein